MPLPVGRLGFAIVAHNVHHALQIGWHGVFRNVSSPRLPGRRHALLTDDGLLANGAAVVKSGEFAEAVRMNRVTCDKKMEDGRKQQVRLKTAAFQVRSLETI